MNCDHELLVHLLYSISITVIVSIMFRTLTEHDLQFSCVITQQQAYKYVCGKVESLYEHDCRTLEWRYPYASISTVYIVFGSDLVDNGVKVRNTMYDTIYYQIC